jgi:hypothetical protein
MDATLSGERPKIGQIRTFLAANSCQHWPIHRGNVPRGTILGDSAPGKPSYVAQLSTRPQFRPTSHRACRKALTMLISTLPNHQVRSHAWEQAACGCFQNDH